MDQLSEYDLVPIYHSLDDDDMWNYSLTSKK